MNAIANILRSKADSAVHSIRPDASVFEAVQLMALKNIGALLARSSKDTPLRDIMTTAVMYVRPDQTCEECMALMTENRVRHLPVMMDGKLIGLISIGDLVKHIISEQKFVIEQLEHYISGQRN